MWYWYGFDKKHDRTRYAELVFWHLVGAMGHIVNSGATRAQNSDALFFMLVWKRYRFNKKRAGTRYVELLSLHLVGSTGHVVQLRPGRKTFMNYFSCSSGTGSVFIKCAPGHVTTNLCS
jgi:hypothetical protein